MRVRAYCDGDWAAVRDIYDLAKPDEMRGVVTADIIPALDHDPEMQVLFRESEVFVMEDDNRIVGFGGNRGNSISWLFVHPAHRRRGVATALVQAITSRLKGSVTLNVATDNTAARRLYERLGFSVEREFMVTSRVILAEYASCVMRRWPNFSLNPDAPSAGARSNILARPPSGAPVSLVR